MRLYSRARRASLAFTQLLMDGADADAPVDAYGKFAARHQMSFSKNMICVEPSFLIIVGGVWEPPNSSRIYGGVGGSGADVDASQTGDQGNINVSQVQGLTLNRLSRCCCWCYYTGSWRAKRY